MQRFLFVMFEAGGNVPPMLGIVRRLAARGHTVRVLGDRVLEAGIRQAGAEYAPFRHAPHLNAFDMMQRAEAVLVLTSRAFDPGPDPLPAHVRYVGPQIDDPEWAAPFRSPFADEVGPLVLVGLGSTFQNQAPVVQRTIDAMGTMPVRGLVTLGRVFEPAEFQGRPNVRVLGSAPHGAILPQASAVIAHGGHGTVIKALSAGVPVLCVPLGRDQKETSTRVVEAGAGLTLSPSASPRAIAAAVRRLLDEPGFREAARAQASRIAEQRTTDLAVEELEALGRGRAAA